jgi:valyl-tRNA synthetase
LPFQSAMISGHGLDEQGRKISKRLGNYTPPEKIIEEYGADAIRYWATGATLGQSLRFNILEVKKGRRTTTKLWNVARLMAMHTKKAQLLKDTKNLERADIWILEELNKTIETVTKNFENYTYAKAKDAIDEFFWSRFADYYVEFIKYRLFGIDKKSKDAAVQTLATVFYNVIKMYAPIMPFVTEEIFQAFFKGAEPTKSIHVSKWPEIIKFFGKTDVSDFKDAIKAVDEIRKFKTKKGISLGAEIDKMKLKTKVNLRKYGEFLKNVGRVKKIINA